MVQATLGLAVAMEVARPLPADLSTARCADAAGWWFSLRCTAPGCSACVDYPLRLLMLQRHCEATSLVDIARRFRCKRCGTPPSTVLLTERPDRRPGTKCGGGGYSEVIDLLPLLGRL